MSFGMKSTGVICLLAVMFATVAQGQLCSGVGAQCSALAALSIRVSGLGSCSGTSSAQCSAFAAATQPCIATIIETIEIGECRPEDVEIFAECAAFAVAEVYASAYAQVECTGADAAGCGFAQTNGAAWACSFAQAIADLVVNVNDGQAQCDTDVEAIAEAFADAAASAQAEACANPEQGFASDFADDFAEAAQGRLATAVTSCFIECDENFVPSSPSSPVPASPVDETPATPSPPVDTASSDVSATTSGTGTVSEIPVPDFGRRG